MAVQEVRRIEGSIQPADDCAIFHGNGNANHQLVTGFLIMRE